MFGLRQVIMFSNNKYIVSIYLNLPFQRTNSSWYEDIVEIVICTFLCLSQLSADTTLILIIIATLYYRSKLTIDLVSDCRKYIILKIYFFIQNYKISISFKNFQYLTTFLMLGTSNMQVYSFTAYRQQHVELCTLNHIKDWHVYELKFGCP